MSTQRTVEIQLPKKIAKQCKTKYNFFFMEWFHRQMIFSLQLAK